MPFLDNFRRAPQHWNAVGAVEAVEAQDGELFSALRVELLNESGQVPEVDSEEGGVLRFDAPVEGFVTRVSVKGQVTLLVKPSGELIIDQRAVEQ